MTERERADIGIYLGSSLITTVPITAGSRRVRKLMESDYIQLEFKTDEPVEFPLGAFVNDELFGKFYVTDEQAPSFNQALHGYDYKLQFNAHYYRWQKQFVCMLRTLGGTEARSEKMWTLTTSLRNQMREFMINLQILGYVPSSYNFRDDIEKVHGTDKNALDYFVVIDNSVENEMQSLTMSYSSTYMLDALKTMADTWGCEYWIEGDESSFKIHFGTCEYGTNEQIISLDTFTEDGEDIPATAEAMTFDKDSSDGDANLLYYFGGTQNIPNTYRKELRLKACDVIKHGVTDRIFLNGYKTFGDTNEKLDLRTFIGDPDNANAKQNKFTVSIPSTVLGGGTYRAGEQSVTGDKLIATKFFAAHSNLNTSTLRRFVSVRICGGCKMESGEVVRILSASDWNNVRSEQIAELRVLADLVIYEYKSTGTWTVVDYVPLPLTYEQWFGLIVKDQSPLSGKLIYPTDISNYYQEYRTLKFRGWLTLNDVALDVNIPLRPDSVSTRLPYSSYLKNEGSISDYLNNYQIVNVTITDFFTYVVNDGSSSTQKKFSLDSILPGSGKFNPNRRADISLVVTFTGNDNQTYNMTDPPGYYLGSYLSPSNVKPDTAVTFTIKSNTHLNKMEWGKVLDDTSSPDTLYRTGNNYYIRLFKKNTNYPTSFDRNMRLTPKVEFEGIKEMSCSVIWSEEDFYNSLNYDITEIKRTDFNAALSETVWVAKDASDTSIDTIYKYYSNTYENRNFESGNTLIDTIDISSQEGGNQRNLIAHTADTLEGTNRARVLGFCPDVETFALYNRLDLTVPEQTLNYQVNLYWGDNGFDHAVVGLRMKLVFATVGQNNQYDCITDFNTGSFDEVAIDVSAQEVTFEPSSGGAQISLPIHLPYTTWTLDDENFWERINRGGASFLPYIVARGYVTFYDSNNQPIGSSSYEIRGVSLTNINDFNFDIEFYAGEIDAQVLWNTQSETILQQIDILNTNIPESAIREGTEFVIYSDYDNKVPYKWFTDEMDNPASVLSIGDVHLQLPVINEKKFEQYKLPGMSLLRSEGYLYIVKDDMAYRDGCIFPIGMIQNPDRYFRNEKCVINENIYPMAICLIMRQDNTYTPGTTPPVYPKGVFTEDKTEYVNVEGEDANNRLSYPWQQYHVNIGIPTINGSTTTIEELAFSKDYVLQNGQALKMRFLIPNDVKDLVAEDVMSLLEDNAHCKLAGMTFEVAFNAQTSYKHSGSATATVHTLDYAIARNEDFGAKLPSDVLCPSNLDPCVLENWNVKALSAMGLMDKAEYRLLDKAFDYFKAMHDNNLTVTADMMSDWMFLLTGRYDTLIEAQDKVLVESQNKVLKARGGMEGYSIPDIGMKVCVKHASLKNGEKHTRVLGYEMKLDKPYDTPKLIMGESEATSRLKRLEKEITKLS